MENSNKFSLKKFFRSFGFALTGMKELIKHEQNAQVHLFISIGVILAGFLLHISAAEWCIIALCIGLVFAAESFNTVIEKLVDHLFPHKHETARLAKDIAAGAVLFCALMSAVCGVIILLPKLLDLIL
ncbi:MAG TPA: diacylglycerol kinase family protein [Bacteroidales bacterium]|nr:diacylglycerol kinase family protein [Bacteroidales bacterium]